MPDELKPDDAGPGPLEISDEAASRAALLKEAADEWAESSKESAKASREARELVERLRAGRDGHDPPG